MTREEILNIASITGPIVNDEGWLYGGIQDLLRFANIVEKIVREQMIEEKNT